MLLQQEQAQQKVSALQAKVGESGEGHWLCGPGSVDAHLHSAPHQFFEIKFFSFLPPSRNRAGGRADGRLQGPGGERAHPDSKEDLMYAH